MAVRLNPCHGCPVPKLVADADCISKRSEMRTKVRGLGLSSAAFKCPILPKHFRNGRRVSINTPILKYGRYHDDGFNVCWKEVKATVLAFDGRRFQCVIDLADMEQAREESDKESDKEAKDFIYRKPMLAARVVSFLDEPDKPLCKGGNVANDEGKCDRETCHECHPIDFGWL